MKKIKISKVLLALWYVFCLYAILFVTPAWGIMVIITAGIEWLWKGPLSRHGLTWTIRK